MERERADLNEYRTDEFTRRHLAFALLVVTVTWPFFFPCAIHGYDARLTALS